MEITKDLILYHINGDKGVVTEVNGDDLVVLTKKVISVSFNDKKTNEITTVTETGNIKRNQIGTDLFLTAAEAKDANDKLLNQLEQERIVRNAPNCPKLTSELLETKLNEYMNQEKSMSEEKTYFDDIKHYVSQERPYFARMDFKTDYFGEIYYDKIYIGYSMVINNDHTYVYDWRSPVCRTYYMKNVTSMIHNEYKYDLLLRRNLSIIKSELVKYNNEFVLGNEQYDGVTDLFLLDILKEKALSSTLTDIVKSIQANQDTIIRQDIKKNMIVQGCAGSGKTMILLHRLSYIKYNHPKLKFDTVKIITPNLLFDTHINDLSNELELEKIKRLTMEQYYFHLLDLYKAPQDMKSKEYSAEIYAEQNFVDYIYSKKFCDLLDLSFSVWLSKYKSEMNLEKILTFSNRYDLKFTEEQNANVTFKRIKDIIHQIISKNNDNKKIIIEKEKILDYRNSKIKNAKSEKSPAISDLKNEIYSLKKQLLTEDELVFLKSAEKSSNIKISEVYKQAIGQLVASKELAFGFIRDKRYFKFDLYILLFVCNKFFGPLDKKDTFINIDEGQDICPLEYHLINKINGGKVVFNIYGDTNQLIYKNRGVNDWQQIPFVSNFFELNENYRNTVQITEYANKLFGLNATAIGLKGDEVKVIAASDHLKMHIEGFQLETGLRKAIIVKNEQLFNLIVQENSLNFELFNLIDSDAKKESDEKLNVYTIINAKGIEFNNVLVLDRDMTDNEKYIAITRALSNLTYCVF